MKYNLLIVSFLTEFQREIINQHFKYVNLTSVLTFLDFLTDLRHKFTKHFALVVSNFLLYNKFIYRLSFESLNYFYAPYVLILQVTPSIILIALALRIYIFFIWI